MSPHNCNEFPMTLSIFVRKLLGEQFSKLYVFVKNIIDHQFKTYFSIKRDRNPMEIQLI